LPYQKFCANLKSYANVTQKTYQKSDGGLALRG
jgi:hypothetical protein